MADQKHDQNITHTAHPASERSDDPDTAKQPEWSLLQDRATESKQQSSREVVEIPQKAKESKVESFFTPSS